MDFKHINKELEALKGTKYEENNQIFFIFPDEPDRRDWEEAKKYYWMFGKKAFYKVLSSYWSN